MSKRAKSSSGSADESGIADDVFNMPPLPETENGNEDDTNVAEIVLSNKGGPKLIHGGFMYTLHKKQPYNIRWRCVGRTMHCRGSLITTINCTKPRVRMGHNHKPDYAAAQVARKRYLALGKPRVLPDEKVNLDSAASSYSRKDSDEAADLPCRRSVQDGEHPSTRQSTLRPKTRASARKGSLARAGASVAGGTGGDLATSSAGTAAAATAGRLVLVAGTDAVKLTPHRLIQEQRAAMTSAAAPAVANDLKEGIRLEGIAMKQEPEDEDDCYLDEAGMPPPSPSSGARHGGSTHRVRSHARSLRAMANPSAVWAHFDLCANDPLRAQCRICGAVVVRGGANPRQCGTTNLHRHLRVHHGGRLIGRRYHVLQAPSQTNTTGKTIRIAAQSLVRPHIRNIAPAPLPQSQQQQQQRQPKTLVLKTIPLKVKQVAPTTIKMPPRQTTQGLPQNIVHQQPTEVCLRWNSYHSNMQNSFPSLLDSEQFVDVTLACEGRSLKCHKMILSSCSDYLAELLRENPCQHPIILMKDLKFWEVEALVKFMYRGEVNVAHDKLPQLLNAAEALQVKGLAGPSPSSQNPKPPMLIPQSKPLASQPIVPRVVPETKENKPSSSGVSSPSSPKRAQKRQQTEPAEPRPFTKIRLQRPPTPTSPCATVKMEPLDIPLSPTEIFPENNEDSSNPSNFEKLMSLHEEDDPGGDEANDDEADREINFCEIPGAPDLNDAEDHMEFVPTDFLEQEQDIVEEAEPVCNKESKEESADRGSADAGVDERGRDEGQQQCSKEKKPV